MVRRYMRYERPWAYYKNCVLWSNVCVIWRLWIHWFHDPGAIIPNGSVTIWWTSLVGVGHWRLDSIVLLMLHTVCCTMAGAPTLYYRSLRIVQTLLRMGNISGRPYMRVMTYNALAFLCIKTIRQWSPLLHHKLWTLKPIKWCINEGSALFLAIFNLHIYFH
jgi:hypothetical protein